MTIVERLRNLYLLGYRDAIAERPQPQPSAPVQRSAYLMGYRDGEADLRTAKEQAAAHARKATE